MLVIADKWKDSLWVFVLGHQL